MKNKIIFNLKDKLKLKITGPNINRFIMKLIKNNIDILENNVISKNETNITIYKGDYEKVKKIKSIYNIKLYDAEGIIKIKSVIRINKYVIIFALLAVFMLKTLTNMIFKIEIVHNDSNIREIIKEELENNNIKKYKFKKDFNTLEVIKKSILEKHRDRIEWLEIINEGTKYIVRVEERKIINKEEDNQPRNIIAKKNGIIKEIKARSGAIQKQINEYVKENDIIISGDIYLAETLKESIKAEGEVYAEVWYEIDIEYPFIYNEETETGAKNKVYVLNVFNKTIELFNFNKYKTKKIEETKILYGKYLPISFSKQIQRETRKIADILTIDEAINKANDKANKQIESNLKENEHIINSKVINMDVSETNIKLKIFYTVYENITKYMIIDYNESE